MERSIISQYENAGFFVLRTPLLPYARFFELSPYSLSDSPPRSISRDAASDFERTHTLARIREALARPEIREAILLASPGIYQGIEGLQRKEPEAEVKLAGALYRYLCRMSTRSTPFGLFAGMSVGRLARSTHLRLAPITCHRRYTSIDSSVIFQAAQALEASPLYRKTAAYYPNNGLYRVGGRLRYAETSFDDSSSTVGYQLVSLDTDEWLDSILKRAQDGVALSHLIDFLTSEAELQSADAEEFIHALVDNQILVSDASGVVTGEPPIADLCLRTKENPETGLQSPLTNLAYELRELDARGLGQDESGYQGVMAQVARLPTDEGPISRLCTVDLWKPLESNQLGREVVTELRATLEQLYRIAPRQVHRELNELVVAFQDRYGEERVPLSLALDAELGLAGLTDAMASESSEALDGLDFQEREFDEEPRGEISDGQVAFLLRRLHEAWSRGDREWRLSENDLRSLEIHDKAPLPSSFVAWISLGRPSSMGGGASYEMLFSSATGPPAARYFGRFAHGSPELTEQLRHLARQEARCEPDALVAEVVHLPQGRAGNVVFRPVLRDYEIPYLGRSGINREQQLPIDDLWLGAAEGQFELWSRRLGRRILPRLTCAHNSSLNSVPIYRFLATLQFQNVTWLGWKWGPLSMAPRLPRVRLGNVIVSRAMWRLDQKELEPFKTQSADTQVRHVADLRARYALPRWVSVVEGDNALVIDLESMMGVETLAGLVKSRSHLRLVESWPEPDKAFVPGEDGTYANEILIPFVRRVRSSNHEPADDGKARRSSSSDKGRGLTEAMGEDRVPDGVSWSFPPGSEWLVFRLVVGKSIADHLLLSTLDECVNKLIEEEICDQWFFHPLQGKFEPFAMMLGLHGESERLENTAALRVGRHLRSQMGGGPLLSWSTQTYRPSVDLYGGSPAFRHIHRIFHADSEASAQLLRKLVDSGDESLRWLVALASVSSLMADLGLGLDARIEVTDRLRAQRLRALPTGPNVERSLSRKFRNSRAQIETLIETHVSPELPFDISCILSRRREVMEESVRALHTLHQQGDLSRPWLRVVLELIRGASERVLRGAVTAHELVIFDSLWRAYRSTRGRSGGAGHGPRLSPSRREVSS